MAKKLLSPFRRAPRHTIAALRLFAHTSRDWERAFAAGRPYIPLSTWGVFYNAPADLWPKYLRNEQPSARTAYLWDVFHTRALARVEKLPNWAELDELYKLARLRTHDPKAYELSMLRREVAALRQVVEAK